MLTSNNIVVIAGGNDLEMDAAKKLATLLGIEVIDRNLGWGAKTSEVTPEIENGLSAGKTVICLELYDDAGYGEGGCDRVIILDHHGEHAGNSSMLEQLHEWLRSNVDPDLLPDLTRHQMLIVANDTGGMQGLLDAGASLEEAMEIRKKEYLLQGITEMELWQASAAADTSMYNPELDLSTVHCAHTKCGPITDYLMVRRIKKGTKKEGNVLVLPAARYKTDRDDLEVNFFGDGRVVLSLNAVFPESWIGGSLPKRGFWGTSKGGSVAYALHDIINEVLVALTALTQKRLLETPKFKEREHEEGPFKPTF